MHRRRACFVSSDDALATLSENHNFGIANHPVRALVDEAIDIRRRLASVCLGHFRHGLEHALGSVLFNVHSSQKIRTDHF
jgi:hypothetical protein